MLHMKPEIRKQWCDALRSGEYEQAKGNLRVRNEDGKYDYCCLGVLTDLYVKAGNPENYSEDDIDNRPVTLNVWEDGTLAVPVTEWAGLAVSNPTLMGRLPGGDHDTPDVASFWNDDNEADFHKIADMIDGGEQGLTAKLKQSLKG